MFVSCLAAHSGRDNLSYVRRLHPLMPWYPSLGHLNCGKAVTMFVELKQPDFFYKLTLPWAMSWRACVS